MDDILREFILETQENLQKLDLDLVKLEKDPTDRDTIHNIFRHFHTIKGTAGFLGLKQLQTIAHAAESLLIKLREGELLFNAEIANAVLGVVDVIRRMLTSLEVSGEEGSADFENLLQTLERLRSGKESWRSPVAKREAQSLAGEVLSPVAAPPARIEAAPSALPPTRPEPAAPLASPLEAAMPAPEPKSKEPAVVVPPVSLPAPAAPAPRASEPSRTPPPPGLADEPSMIVPLAEPPRPPKPPPPPEASEPRPSTISDTAIRVDVGLLDKLMTLVGELVLVRNQILQFSTAQENAVFQSMVQPLNLLTAELQTNVMKTRMQPIRNLWSKFPRLVRDLAVACGKQVRIVMDGQDTELDRTIIEAIRDPLTHLVRNAVDHGIELPARRVALGKPMEGRLVLHAFHEGGKVILEITDDGGGIDPRRIWDKAVQAKIFTPEQADRLTDSELIDLIFLPGFSTADRITHFSGRGVGMDVVRTNVEKTGGSVSIESKVGRGTTVKMKIPLTLAIIPALIITSGGERFAIPQVSLLELLRLEGDQIQRSIEYIHGTPVYRLRGKLLPLVYLNRQLNLEDTLPAAADGTSELNLVVLQADDRPFGLVVDVIHDTEEIVVKPLQKQLKGINVFAGATIMGDGKVALILDIVGLAQRAHVVKGVRESILGDKESTPPERPVDRQTVLLFTTTDGTRMAIPLLQVARLEEFPRSALERVGTQDMVQYRDEILPLFDVSRLLRQKRRRSGSGSRRAFAGEAPPAASRNGHDDTVQVVVYAGPTQQAGLVVHSILDIVEEAIVSRSRANRPGVLYSAVIQGRVTEFLDVEGILRTVDPIFFEPPRTVTAET